jgi:hypothetical protein
MSSNCLPQPCLLCTGEVEQRSANAVVLESLLTDEGIGTLDSEGLEEVANMIELDSVLLAVERLQVGPDDAARLLGRSRWRSRNS